jgi:hypothetical protein
MGGIAGIPSTARAMTVDLMRSKPEYSALFEQLDRTATGRADLELLHARRTTIEVADPEVWSQDVGNDVGAFAWQAQVWGPTFAFDATARAEQARIWKDMPGMDAQWATPTRMAELFVHEVQHLRQRPTRTGDLTGFSGPVAAIGVALSGARDATRGSSVIARMHHALSERILWRELDAEAHRTQFVTELGHTPATQREIRDGVVGHPTWQRRVVQPELHRIATLGAVEVGAVGAVGVGVAALRS